MSAMGMRKANKMNRRVGHDKQEGSNLVHSFCPVKADLQRGFRLLSLFGNSGSTWRQFPNRDMVALNWLTSNISREKVFDIPG